jgi:phosphoribosylformylglycinamidine cyclo-ligase
MTKAYAQAGVDIALAERLLDEVKPVLKSARRPESLGAIGGFGGLFDISRLKLPHPVLVSSTDSVGTKVTVARLAGDFRTLGADIVNHCANDVAVCGAEPLFFLDYYATTRLNEHYVPLLTGLARACKAGNIALVGGETAELPGVYADGECDLVGTIVGAVSKPKIITGQAIRPGDVLVGLASSGLHTNGFSLARKVLFGDMGLSVTDPLPGARTSVGRALLQPHVNYAPFIQRALKRFNRGPHACKRQDNALFGMVHITGGGFSGNIPRVLPARCRAMIDTRTWRPLPVFRAIVSGGNIAFDEQYEVFNMGIGMVLIVAPASTPAILKLAEQSGHRAFVIGCIDKGERGVDVVGPQ